MQHPKTQWVYHVIFIYDRIYISNLCGALRFGAMLYLQYVHYTTTQIIATMHGLATVVE